MYICSMGEMVMMLRRLMPTLVLALMCSLSIVHMCLAQSAGLETITPKGMNIGSSFGGPALYASDRQLKRVAKRIDEVCPDDFGFCAYQLGGMQIDTHAGRVFAKTVTRVDGSFPASLPFGLTGFERMAQIKAKFEGTGIVFEDGESTSKGDFSTHTRQYIADRKGSTQLYVLYFVFDRDGLLNEIGVTQPTPDED